MYGFEYATWTGIRNAQDAFIRALGLTLFPGKDVQPIKFIQASSYMSPSNIGVGVIISQPTIADFDPIKSLLDAVFADATRGTTFIQALRDQGMNMTGVSRITDPYLVGGTPVAVSGMPSASVYAVVGGASIILPIKDEAMLVMQMTVAYTIQCNQSTTTVSSVTPYAGPGVLLNFTFYESDASTLAHYVTAFNAMNASGVCTTANENGMAGAVTSFTPASPLGVAIPPPLSQLTTSPIPPLTSPTPPDTQALPAAMGRSVETSTPVTVIGYTEATFTPQFRSAFISALALATGASAPSLTISHVRDATGGGVTFTIEGPATNATAVIQSARFLTDLHNDGMTATTAVRSVSAPASKSPPIRSTSTSTSSTRDDTALWVLLGCVVASALGARVYMYVRSRNNHARDIAPRGDGAPSKQGSNDVGVVIPSGNPITATIGTGGPPSSTTPSLLWRGTRRYLSL